MPVTSRFVTLVFTLPLSLWFGIDSIDEIVWVFVTR
jgi:hypothetical protein